jgi:hypothetical protein
MLIGKPAIMILIAVKMAAPCIAKAGSASNPCGSLKADAAKGLAEFEIIREGGPRTSLPGWCGIARNIIRVEEHMIAVANHDPSHCRMPRDRLEELEASRKEILAHTEGCP